MKFLEKDLEDIIFNTSAYELFKRGLDIMEYNIRKRQLKIGNYGIADIVLFNRESFVEEPYLHINVIELKKDILNIDSLMQAARYAKGIERYIFHKRKKSIEVKFGITLIGSSLDLNSSFVHLTDVITNNGFDLKMYKYTYEFDGIRFHKREDFSLTNEGF